ncbi:unnamed protein product [Ceutorhynchus assimilis]|uniref:COX assembly mitochondrial protein n=1 Tax=Ceutorhynchus assimilis TaxID=467358 RepID=A0A9N9MLE4_9CUCU|nr:unnamed protein product [Ceutorhynchus assimilis]
MTHTDLSPHLHTDKCNQMVELWRQCRKDNFFKVMVGYCNSHYDAMADCLKSERLARRAENQRKARESKKRISERIKALELEEEKKKQEA